MGGVAVVVENFRYFFRQFVCAGVYVFVCICRCVGVVTITLLARDYTMLYFVSQDLYHMRGSDREREGWECDKNERGRRQLMQTRKRERAWHWCDSTASCVVASM